MNHADTFTNRYTLSFNFCLFPCGVLNLEAGGAHARVCFCCDIHALKLVHVTAGVLRHTLPLRFKTEMPPPT